ncbi:MAG: AMP-binding protein [Deltaproteobacteria bacterium]|nr:AMP-binding protein [Deltaproteobacteria bacterium]MBW2395431.1 AMP-binding protein [Deltaproteobacteria bacterium]
MRVPLTVRDHLDRALAVYPERIAFVDEPDQPAPSLGETRFSELGELSRAMGAGLDRLGLPNGARVAMVSQNASRLLTCFWGVSGNGRVFVPINFRLSPEEIKYIVSHCGADVLLIDPELEESLAGVPCKHRFVLGAESDERMFDTQAEPKPWEPDEDQTAVINYTSGTTARPKGVEQTHRSLWLNAAVFGWQTGVNDRDVYLHTLPQFHCNGWGMPYALVGMGAKQIVLRKIDGAEILRRVQQHGVTLLCGAPAVVQTILDAATSWDGPVPGRGQTRIVVAGAPPPTRTIEQVETELGWEFIQIYGLTETAPLLTMSRSRAEWDDLTPAERAQKLGRAGAPALGVRVQTDTEGEIMARTNHVLEGYWEQPEATAEAIRDGWFYTGDGGRIDEDGYLAIADRKKDVIISGGENVSSIEVEDALFSHAEVSEVAVIGVPHEKWGETVKALIVLGPGSKATEQDLIDHCRSKIAHYKCPTSIEFRDELARTATGKLQKYKLRQPYWEGMDKGIN